MPSIYLVAAIVFAVVGYLAKVCCNAHLMLCAQLTSNVEFPGRAEIASCKVARHMALQVYQSRPTLPHLVGATNLLRRRASPEVWRCGSDRAE